MILFTITPTFSENQTLFYYLNSTDKKTELSMITWQVKSVDFNRSFWRPKTVCSKWYFYLILMFN